MASCSSCGTNVGCGCNLISGKCGACYGKSVSSDNTNQTFNVPTIPSTVPANTEFNVILSTKGLSKEEKLKRINDILEKARQDYVNQS